MICEKKGRDCSLLFRGRCAFGDAGCNQIVDQCIGCNKVAKLLHSDHCRCFANPAAQ